jgi:hypothetical protein
MELHNQATAHGKIVAAIVRSVLTRNGITPAAAHRPNQASRHGLAPGTVLVREWDGKPQRVMVLKEGFGWNGTTYRSLTEIAFAMTGTRWSGPRFFGIRSRPEKPA